MTEKPTAPTDEQVAEIAALVEQRRKQAVAPLRKHAPFEQGECDACHNPAEGNKLFASAEELCFRCHEDYAQTYDWVHGPVAVGFCQTCHEPHESRNDFLLISTSQDICFKCHSREDIFSAEYHKTSQSELCTSCHDPHGGSNRWLLKTEVDFSAENSLVIEEM